MPRKNTTPGRYTVYDARKRQYSGLGSHDRFPWKIVDSHTGQIVDEFLNGNAARSTAAKWNRDGKD